MNNVVCVSHGKDSDGLICAALLSHLKNASLFLIDYDELKDTLQNIKQPTKEVFICDIGLRESIYDEIIRISKFADVTIVDHHPTSKKILNILKLQGIKVVFNEKECASILLYSYFKDGFNKEAARLAVYAAISDQFDKGLKATQIITQFDKHFIQHEALILTHALEHKISNEKKIAIVQALRRFVYPHKINWVVKMALSHLEYMRILSRTLPKKAQKLKRMAFVESEEKSSMGTVSSLLLNSMNIDVGLCYKKNEDKNVNISIRGKNKIKLHLGEITKKIAEKYGGFGGGHMKASGANIPQKNFEKFINDFAIEINK